VLNSIPILLLSPVLWKGCKVMCVKNLSVLISFILLLSFTGGVACAQTPVGFWPFEEGGGGTTADLGSGGNDGTLTGDAAFVNDAQRGKCIELSGSGYINIPSGVIEFGDGFTNRCLDKDLQRWKAHCKQIRY